VASSCGPVVTRLRTVNSNGSPSSKELSMISHLRA
jgi:hypothetical protein